MYYVGLGLIVSTSFDSDVDHLPIGEGKERIEYLFYNKYISLLISTMILGGLCPKRSLVEGGVEQHKSGTYLYGTSTFTKVSLPSPSLTE